MFKFIINYVCGDTIKSKGFDSVAEGYAWAVENIANAGDYEWYKECCGKDLKDVHGDTLQEVVLKNSFERIRFVGWRWVDP